MDMEKYNFFTDVQDYGCDKDLFDPVVAIEVLDDYLGEAFHAGATDELRISKERLGELQQALAHLAKTCEWCANLEYADDEDDE